MCRWSVSSFRTTLVKRSPGKHKAYLIEKYWIWKPVKRPVQWSLAFPPTFTHQHSDSQHNTQHKAHLYLGLISTVIMYIPRQHLSTLHTLPAILTHQYCMHNQWSQYKTKYGIQPKVKQTNLNLLINSSHSTLFQYLLSSRKAISLCTFQQRSAKNVFLEATTTNQAVWVTDENLSKKILCKTFSWVHSKLLESKHSNIVRANEQESC